MCVCVGGGGEGDWRRGRRGARLGSRNYEKIPDLLWQTVETICMKCQILFSGKNKKNIINLSSAEFAQRMVKVKQFYSSLLDT